jgi:hypothetical protein
LVFFCCGAKYCRCFDLEEPYTHNNLSQKMNWFCIKNDSLVEIVYSYGQKSHW